MAQIDRTGTFRGSVVDFGLATTKNEYPQLILALRGEEYYDEDEKQWVSWEGVEETDITAYLVLFGTDKTPIFHIRQLQKALGWDGLSFSSLVKIEWENLKLTFRVETHIYNGASSLKITNVDAYDAEPGRSISKLDDEEVKKLDAVYA